MNSKQKKAYKQKIENLLAPRLGILGWIMIFFSALSFTYGIYIHPLPFDSTSNSYSDIQIQGLDTSMLSVGRDDPSTLIPEDILNFYFVAALFLAVGSFCIYTYKKRKPLIKP